MSATTADYVRTLAIAVFALLAAEAALLAAVVGAYVLPALAHRPHGSRPSGPDRAVALPRPRRPVPGDRRVER